MNKPRVQVSGIEAIVCADIAQRQARGIAKYGTTVAANPLPLRAWLQHQYEELLDAAVYARRAIAELDAREAAAAAPNPRNLPPVGQRPPQATWHGKPVGRYTFMGQKLTVGQLATYAGCSWSCMQARLKLHTPEAAVALGPPAARARRAPTTAQAPAGQATFAPGVKVTKTPPLKDRFAVANTAATFGRIGHYESTGSALERAANGTISRIQRP